MTFLPALPPFLLATLAAVVLGAHSVALRRLLTTGPARSALWRWGGITVAAVLLLAAAARPVLGLDADDTTRVAGDTAPNVFVVLDRSPGMQVSDAGDRSRMSAARDDIAALIDEYPDARFAVISFAARPSLEWPLSVDTWSLRPVMSAVSPYTLPSDVVTQTNVGAAANVLRYQLIGAQQQYPRAKNLVFYLGAGAPESDAPQREFDLPDGAVDGGAVLGYGSARALRPVAEQIGVPYLSRSAGAPLGDVLPTEVSEVAPGVAAESPSGTELYWFFAMGAAVLILLELYLVLREFRRTRFAGTDVMP